MALMSDPAILELNSLRVERVADGVYAALPMPGRGAVGNAGIVDLGGATLVFDTLRTPAAAADLLAAARQLTRRAPAWVVNSHWHDDHVAGNQIFQPAAQAILATPRTRDLMTSRLVADYEQDARDLPAYLESLQARADTETDPARRAALTTQLAETRAYADALPAIQVTLPTLTFDASLYLHGSRRAISLQTYGGGHTASDAFLYLPDERVLFTGDLAFLHLHPWLPDGDPDEWQRILDRLERLEPLVVIPGHGPVTGAVCLSLTRRYITQTQALARQLADTSATEDEISATPIPAPFEDWELPNFFDANLRFLIGFLRSAQSAS
jgi:glyoxylase-like metal-dependent hydrolase (beta-lactamase superfamily II)